MAIFLSEADILSLVTIKDAIEAVSEVFKIRGDGDVINPPRQQIDIPGGYLRLTSAIVNPMQKIAVKVSSSMVFDSDSGRTLLLVDSRTGRVDAIIEVFRLGALRTAAASGVATQLLARKDADSVGVFGTGRQARTQIAAVAAVRPIKNVIAIGRNADRLNAFCIEMSKELAIPVTAAKDPLELYQCAVLVAATTSAEPVIFGEHLRPGTHINAVGANRLERREMDDAVIERCALVTVDNKVQAEKESAVLLRAVERGVLAWDDVLELGAFMAGAGQDKCTSDGITLYNSHGVAMEDVALATKAFELALEKGVGTDVPFTPA
ncbi:MAG: ornithine cyclodeaminase family protein [Proteobacteria bacterium]|nr:ornithine cyclodeaminase family protein [Pseudomonadota bacterium]